MCSLKLFPRWRAFDLVCFIHSSWWRNLKICNCIIVHHSSCLLALGMNSIRLKYKLRSVLGLCLYCSDWVIKDCQTLLLIILHAQRSKFRIVFLVLFSTETAYEGTAGENLSSVLYFLFAFADANVTPPAAFCSWKVLKLAPNVPDKGQTLLTSTGVTKTSFSDLIFDLILKKDALCRLKKSPGCNPALT